MKLVMLFLFCFWFFPSWFINCMFAKYEIDLTVSTLCSGRNTLKCESYNPSVLSFPHYRTGISPQRKKNVPFLILLRQLQGAWLLVLPLGQWCQSSRGTTQLMEDFWCQPHEEQALLLHLLFNRTAVYQKSRHTEKELAALSFTSCFPEIVFDFLAGKLPFSGGTVTFIFWTQRSGKREWELPNQSISIKKPMREAMASTTQQPILGHSFLS